MTVRVKHFCFPRNTQHRTAGSNAGDSIDEEIFIVKVMLPFID